VKDVEILHWILWGKYEIMIFVLSLSQLSANLLELTLQKNKKTSKTDSTTTNE
jgi:hypothetical protein